MWNGDACKSMQDANFKTLFYSMPNCLFSFQFTLYSFGFFFLCLSDQSNGFTIWNQLKVAVNRTRHLFRLCTSNYTKRSISRVNLNLLHVIDQLKMWYFYYKVVKLLVMPKMTERLDRLLAFLCYPRLGEAMVTHPESMPPISNLIQSAALRLSISLWLLITVSKTSIQPVHYRLYFWATLHFVQI